MSLLDTGRVCLGFVRLLLALVRMVVLLLWSRVSQSAYEEVRHMMMDVMTGTPLAPEDYVDTVYR